MKNLSRGQMKNLMGGLAASSNCQCSFTCDGAPRGSVWTTPEDCHNRLNQTHWCTGHKNAICIHDSEPVGTIE